MKNGEKAVCWFEKQQNPITVGDLFELHCKWPPSVFLSVPARIEFPPLKKQAKDHTKNPIAQDQAINKAPKSPENPYALALLETASLLPGKGVFKVTGYAPGAYYTGFQIVSDEGAVHVEPLSWSIKSVIPQTSKGTIKPFPPYGPWGEVLPFWHKSLSVLSLLALLVFVVLKIRFFIRRKRKIKQVTDRLKGKDPFRECISKLNLLARNIRQEGGENFVLTLRKIFCLFLENEFCIFAMNEKSEKIFSRLKNSWPVLYQRSGIASLFKEMDRLSSEKTKAQDRGQLLSMAREAAIKIYQHRQTKEGV